MQVLSTGLVYIFARLLSLIHCPGGSASASSDQSTPKSVRKERAKQAAYQQAEQQQCWRPCSKHTLLQALCDQFQHINDVAALIHHSTASENYIGWRCELAALGLNPAVGRYSPFSLKWHMDHHHRHVPGQVVGQHQASLPHWLQRFLGLLWQEG